MNRFLVVLLLALCGVGAFLAIGGPDDTTPGGAVDGALYADEDDLGGDLDQADADPADVGGPDDAGAWDLDGDASPERTAVESSGAGDARPGPTLVVVDGTAGARPVADCAVFHIEFRDALERGERGTSLHPIELTERFGQRASTDADGRVRLPPVRDRLLVAARVEGRFGTRMLDRRHQDEERLVLVPDQTLEIAVVDASGRPAARIPVGVYQRGTGTRSRRGGRADRGGGAGRGGRAARRGRGGQPGAQPGALGWDRRLRVRTGTDGRVRVPHFQLHRRGAREGGQSEFRAALLVPLREPVSAAFRDDPVPGEPIVLTLPATGSLAVRLVGHDGRAFHNRATITVSARGRPEAGLLLGAGFDSLSRRKERGREPAVFPLLGLGLELAVRVQLDDDDFTWNGPPFRGPVVADERVDVDIAIPDWVGLLAGRVLDPDGTPRGDAEPTFLITGRAGRIEGERLRIGPDGRFELPFSTREPQPPFALELRDAGEHGPIGTTVVLPDLRVGQRTELGDLRLAELARLAAGRVVDDRGAPVRRAHVRLQRWRDLGGSPPRTDWRDEAYQEARTDDDGRFVLFGDPLPGRYRVHASARNHIDAATPDLAPGAVVEILLLRAGSFDGIVRMPDWMPARALRLRLVSSVDPDRSRDARLRARGAAARYSFRDMRPGTYDAVLTLRGFPEPLFRADGIRIEPGDNDPDPRLADLDLSGSLFLFRLRAVGLDGGVVGNPGSPLLARVVRPSGETEFVGFPWRNGRVEIFSASPRLDVVQLGVGYRPRDSVVTYGDTDLLFEKLQPVTLLLRGARAACGVGRRVRVSTVLRSDTGLPSGMRALDQRSGSSRGYSRAQLSKSGGAWLGDGDVVRVPLMRDGTYRVVLRLYEPGVDGPVSTDMADVDVRLDPLTSQRIDVPIDAKKIDAAIAELRRRKSS